LAFRTTSSDLKKEIVKFDDDSTKNAKLSFYEKIKAIKSRILGC